MVAKYQRFVKYKEKPSSHYISLKITRRQLTRAF